MEKVSKCVKETQEWLANMKNIQDKLSHEQDPVVRSSEIHAKLQVRKGTNGGITEIGDIMKLVLESRKTQLSYCYGDFSNQELESTCEPVVTKPKPRVESRVDESKQMKPEEDSPAQTTWENGTFSTEVEDVTLKQEGLKKTEKPNLSMELD